MDIQHNNKGVDKEGFLLLGIIAACIGIPLLLLRHSSNTPKYFSEESSQKPTRWVKTGRTYENTEHWHISWDMENLIPTDVTIKRHAVET